MDFSFARFTSLLGVYSLLLVFAALYLPRTTFLVSAPPPPASSRDKPQHPFLVPLTADPVATLGWFLLGVVILQAWWGGWMRVWWKDSEQDRAKGFSGEDDAARKVGSMESNRQRFSAFRDAWIATLASSIPFYIVLVLLGAPISSHFIQTYLLALLLACLTVYVPAYSLGPPSLASDSNALVHRLTWIRIFAEVSLRHPYERVLAYPVFGAAGGAWLGAFPIALDWDRPWQAWPLTPAYGAIFGSILASWCALIIEGTLFLAEADKQSLAEASSSATNASIQKSASSVSRAGSSSTRVGKTKKKT